MPYRLRCVGVAHIRDPVRALWRRRADARGAVSLRLQLTSKAFTEPSRTKDADGGVAARSDPVSPYRAFGEWSLCCALLLFTCVNFMG